MAYTVCTYAMLRWHDHRAHGRRTRVPMRQLCHAGLQPLGTWTLVPLLVLCDRADALRAASRLPAGRSRTRAVSDGGRHDHALAAAGIWLFWQQVSGFSGGPVSAGSAAGGLGTRDAQSQWQHGDQQQVLLSNQQRQPSGTTGIVGAPSAAVHTPWSRLHTLSIHSGGPARSSQQRCSIRAGAQ